MKKIFILTLISIVSLSTYSQKPHAFVITNEGDTVYMYSHSKKEDVIHWTKGGGFNYRDKNGEKQFLRTGIKVLINGSELYMPMKMHDGKKAGKQMMKILAFNDKYILAAVISGMDMIWVFERGKENPVEDYLLFGINSKRARRKSAEKIEEYITKYFKDCPYVTENFLKNIDGTSYKASANGVKHARLGKNFNTYRCGNAEPIIYNELLNDNGIKIRKEY